MTGEQIDCSTHAEVRAVVVSHTQRVIGSLIMAGATPDQAREALQDAVESILRKRPEMREPAAYLMRAAHNKFRSAMRARVHTEELNEQTTVSQSVPGPEHRVLGAELREKLLQGFKTLPKEQQEVIAMRVDEALPFAEIARITGVAEPTVRKRHSRAVAALREFLRE